MYKITSVKYYNNLAKIFFNKWFFLTSSYSNIYYIYFNSFNFTYIGFLRVKKIFKNKGVDFERIKISKYFFEQQNWMKIFFFFKQKSQLGSEFLLVTNDFFIKNDIVFYSYLIGEYQQLNIVFKQSKKYRERLVDINFRLHFVLLQDWFYSKEYVQDFFINLKKIKKSTYFMFLNFNFMTYFFFF